MNATKILWTFALLFAFAPMMVARGQGPWFRVLDNQAAWEYLPKTISGQRGEALPVWARILARPLPSTTAAMLEMDRVQRGENPPQKSPPEEPEPPSSPSE